MNTLAIESREATAKSVTVTQDALTVQLADGRTLSVPLAWYPRIQHGSVKERKRWRLIGRGEGIHWPGLDEDISVENLLSGIHQVKVRSLSSAGWQIGKPRPDFPPEDRTEVCSRPATKRGGGRLMPDRWAV